MNPNKHRSDTADEGYCAEMNQCVRRNPAATLLVAIVAGLVIGLLVRGLRPTPSPQRRMMNFIDDLHGRLSGVATPVVRRAATIAGDAAEMVRERAHDGEAWIERAIKAVRCRLRKSFH
jgi:ElaB/YqjD/DUF883 family membrane-anchored ribosome-binding protein